MNMDWSLYASKQTPIHCKCLTQKYALFATYDLKESSRNNEISLIIY